MVGVPLRKSGGRKGSTDDVERPLPGCSGVLKEESTKRSL